MARLPQGLVVEFAEQGFQIAGAGLEGEELAAPVRHRLGYLGGDHQRVVGRGCGTKIQVEQVLVPFRRRWAVLDGGNGGNRPQQGFDRCRAPVHHQAQLPRPIQVRQAGVQD